MTGTIERACGHWPEILPQLGIATQFLQNKHGPCPLCGGKDRFRFDNKHGSGSYICGQCGAGPGIILLRKMHGWTHAEACAEVDKIIGTDYRPPALQHVERDDAKRAARIREVIDGARAPKVRDDYLRHRGLAVSSPALLGHAALPYFDDDRKLVGRFPAVVAPIIAPSDEVVSAQRIYADPSIPKGSRKKALPAVGTISGAAVRLHPAAEEMGAGEGAETCLAAHQLFGVPVWAGLTEGGLQSIVIPPTVRRLHIFMDNDGNFVGQAAGFALAKRVHRERRGDIEIIPHVPDEVDTDWLDVLNALEAGR